MDDEAPRQDGVAAPGAASVAAPGVSPTVATVTAATFSGGERQVHGSLAPVLRFSLRAFGYAVTAPLAMVSGLLVGGMTIEGLTAPPNGEWHGLPLFLCLSLFLLSGPIYIAYAYRFPYGAKSSIDNVAGILLGALAVASAIAVGRDEIFSTQPHFWIAAFYSTAAVWWSYLYLRGDREGVDPLIREWVTVPALFSIGLGFTTGYVLGNPVLAGSMWSIAPIAAYTLYFLLASPRLSHRRYIALNVGFLIAVAGFAVAGGLLVPQIALASRVLLVSTVLAAFIATFEAWRVTAFRLARNSHGADRVGAHPFYKSTTWAMALCVLILPLMILLLEYFHMLFYVLVVLLVLGFYGFWLIRGLGRRFGSHQTWSILKTVAGFGTLAVIVADGVTRFGFGGWLIEQRFSELFAYPSLSLYVLALFYLCGSIMKDYLRYKEQSLPQLGDILSTQSLFRRIWSAMLDDPRNAGRLLGIASFIPFLLLFMADFASGCSSANTCSLSSDSLGRLRAAEVIYLLVCVFCVVFDYLERMFDPRTKQDFALRLPESPDGDSYAIRTAIGLAKLVRLPTSLFVLAIVCLSFGLTGNGWARGALLGAPFAVAAMLGFAVNDVWDYRKDAVSKPARAIPGRYVSLGLAKVVVAILFAVGLIWSSAVSVPPGPRALYFVALLGVIAYNYVVKYAAVAKSLMSALLSVSPIAFSLLYLNVTTLSAIMAALAVAYITGREVRMDLLDLQGDLVDHIRTLPMVIGSQKATAVSTLLINGSIAILCVAAVLLMPGASAWIMVLIVVSGQILCEVTWRAGSRSSRRVSIKLQWLPMLAGSLFVLAWS